MTAASDKLASAWNVVAKIRASIKAREPGSAISHGLVDLFTANGGVVDEAGGTWRARLGGFRATCTSSREGAVVNWIAQVQSKWVRHCDVLFLEGGEP